MMKNFIIYVILMILAAILTACGRENPHANQISPTTVTKSIETQAPTIIPPTGTTIVEVVHCSPTIDDGLSPSYQSDAPVRSRVGTGHVLTGVVRSSADCSPIVGAKIELWPEYAELGHPDKARATIFTDLNGRYRFESDPPEHIHMRITAAGYHTIAQNSYHPDGQAEGTFDIVLVPEEK